jgi:hypothetical protein
MARQALAVGAGHPHAGLLEEIGGLLEGPPALGSVAVAALLTATPGV